jgi:hypothetical protein
MNDYIFDICFDPTIKDNNIEHFLDYCLRNLTNSSFMDDEDGRYRPTWKGLANELDPIKLENYWKKNRKLITSRNYTSMDKVVYTLSYSATYKDYLPSIFEILDKH